MDHVLYTHSIGGFKREPTHYCCAKRLVFIQHLMLKADQNCRCRDGLKVTSYGKFSFFSFATRG